MDRILDIFQFNPESPLIFTQIDFWIFFAVIYFGYTLLYDRKRMRASFLFLVSLFFYYKTSGLFIFILIFSTVNDFFIGKAIVRSQEEWKRRLLVGISVTLNLGVLFYFKYAYFFTDSYNALFDSSYEVVNHLAMFANGFFDSMQAPQQWYFLDVDKILLPVGISYYTFQTISYSIDLKRGDLEKPVESIIDFGFFVSFFPQLVAGPIVRASQFIPQIYEDFQLTREEYGRGVYTILKGLAKKIILADYIAINFLDRVFADPMLHSGYENFMAMVGYSLQIYCDFSGYTDIAIGVALLMGFRLPTNFNSPYKAKSAGEFWKRWHITLSEWLRDYLYIPLGGNRNGTLASAIVSGVIIGGVLFAVNDWTITLIVLIVLGIVLIFTFISKPFNRLLNRNINVTLTMLLGGLWHGANWQFVIWGGLNGTGVLVYKYWKDIFADKFRDKLIWHFTTVAILFAGLAAWLLPLGTKTDYDFIAPIVISISVLSTFFSLWEYYRSQLQHLIEDDIRIDYLRYARAVVTYNFFVLLWWHGAVWQFVIWVSGNVLWVIVALFWKRITMPRYNKGRLAGKHRYKRGFELNLRAWKVFVTLVFITFTRVFFRSEGIEKAWQLMDQVWYNFNWAVVGDVTLAYWNIFALMAVGYLIHWLPNSFKDRLEGFYVKLNMPLQIAATVVIVLFIYQFVSAGFTPFIYFQF